MPQRFRSRGCLVVAILLGMLALLSCGGLFLLVTPRPTPDPLAELKRIPPYPGAHDVRYSQLMAPPNTSGVSGGASVWIGTAANPGSTSSGNLSEFDKAKVSFTTLDGVSKVFDYYIGELDRAGWDCSSTGVKVGTFSGTAFCKRMDQGSPKLVFTGFQAAPPWVEMAVPTYFRTTNVQAYKLLSVTRVSVEYHSWGFR